MLKTFLTLLVLILSLIYSYNFITSDFIYSLFNVIIKDLTHCPRLQEKFVQLRPGGQTSLQKPRLKFGPWSWRENPCMPWARLTSSRSSTSMKLSAILKTCEWCEREKFCVVSAVRADSEGNFQYTDYLFFFLTLLFFSFF